MRLSASSTDWKHLNLRGEVREVVIVTRIPVPDGKPYTHEIRFSPDGLLEDKPGIRTIWNAGTRRVIQDTKGMDGISLSSLQGVVIPTGGAVQAETSFSIDGVPVETVFTANTGEETSRIVYHYDERGHLIEVLPASTYALSKQLSNQLPPEVAAALDGMPLSDSVWARFGYDEHSRVVEIIAYLLGKIVFQETRSYNEHGDVESVILKDQGASFEYEYEYDERGNWIRRVTYQPPLSIGSSRNITEDTRRHITYYE